MNDRGPGTGTVIVVSIVTSLIVSTLTIVGISRYGQSAVASFNPAQTAQVPDLSGMRGPAADELLAARGLRLVVSQRRKSDSEADTIIEQTPLPQSRVEGGAQVSVVLSEGQPGPAVPPVVGLQVEQAKAAIQNAGLALGSISAADAGAGQPGTVTAVTPAVGSSLAAGTPVVLTVAQQATAKVPDLLNHKVRDARERIEKAGFTVGEIRERYDNRRKAYVVLEQTPNPNAQVPEGSKIALIVNQGD